MIRDRGLLPNMLKVLLLASAGINGYSFYDPPFVRSPLSVAINLATPVVALIYVYKVVRNRKKIKKKLHEHYQDTFSKN